VESVTAQSSVAVTDEATIIDTSIYQRILVALDSSDHANAAMQDALALAGLTENSVITGDRKKVFEHYRKLFRRGIPSKGPFYYKMPDRFVKRTIRGMLPSKSCG